MTELYFEDFAVGQKFRSATLTVTEERIKSFAREYDPQEFHLDHEAAKATLFGGLAASGWHTAAMTMRLIVDSPLRPKGGVLGAGMDELRWPKPVRPGDTLQVESEVLEIRASKSKPGIGLVKFRITTFNQAGEPVQVFTPSLVVPRRS